jgi:hypothetical protein
VTKPDKSNTPEEEPEDQPPKVEFVPVVEEGTVYSKRYIFLLISLACDSVTF